MPTTHTHHNQPTDKTKLMHHLCIFRISLLCIFCISVQLGCKSDEGKRKDVSLLPAEDDTAMLEEPVLRKTASTAPGKEEALFIPMAGAEMSLEIDGDRGDWSGFKSRSFDDSDAIIDGRRDWKGGKDASMEVSAHADANYFYLLVDVRDDTILSGGQDAVHLWLRDPKLEQIMSSLPKGVSVEDDLTHDLGITILPDGSFSVIGEELDIPKGAVTLSTSTRRGGWLLEAAIAIEVMPFIASLPLSELAFRVDLHDGDKKSKRGAQTIMSMLPYERDDRPRFALLATPEGLAPHLDARGIVARADGVGYWRRESEHWQFNSLEALPKIWRAVSDTSEFFKDLDEPLTCPSRDQQLLTLEAYTTRSARHRIGLVLCSARTTRKGSCPKDAQTELFWVHLARDDSGAYTTKRRISVFEKPLPQCRTEAVKGELLRDHFSTLPLDFVNANIWAVSWRERLDDSTYAYVRHAVQLLSAKTGELMGDVHPLLEREDDGKERVETITMSYFTEVDDVEGLDICEVERLLEQDCASYQRGCTTRSRGSSVMTHISLWAPENEQFERYVERRHKGCPSKFDLSQREGYLLFHTGSRVGLLPSVLNKD